MNLTIPLLVLLLLGPSSPGDESVPLFANFEPGDVTYIEVREDSLEGTADMAPEARRKNTGLIGFYQTVRSADAKGVELELIMERRVFQSWDSDLAEEQESMLASAYGPTLGMNRTIRLDAKNHTESIEGVPAMRAAIRESIGHLDFVNFILSEFSDEEMTREFVDARYVFFPNRRVAVGETWQESRRTTAATTSGWIRPTLLTATPADMSM